MCELAEESSHQAVDGMGYRQATRRKRDKGADGISTQRQPPQACTPWWYPCGLMLGGGTVSGWSTMELFPWSRGSSCRELAACAIRRFVVACRVLTPTCLPEIALWEDPLSALGCPQSWAAWTPGRGLGSMGIQGQNTASTSATSRPKRTNREPVQPFNSAVRPLWVSTKGVGICVLCRYLKTGVRTMADFCVYSMSEGG
jgi:hypothetical protein